MRIFRQEIPAENPVPEQERVCVLVDYMNYDEAPTPTLVEWLVGPDLFRRAPKFTPEETGEALRGLVSRLIPALRRESSQSEPTPPDSA